MNMWASARSFTHYDLRKAFDDYAEAHGSEQATLALERSTGVREVPAVSQERIVNGMVELIAGYSFVGGGTPQISPSTVSKFHADLASIREKAFARMRSKGGHLSPAQ